MIRAPRKWGPRKWGLTPILLAAAVAAPAALAEPYYLIVAGLGGEQSYAAEFAQQADALATAARRSVGDESRVVVLTGKAVSREALEKAFKTMAQKVGKTDSVIVFLLGHGSYDGQHYKFNIPGPDVDGEEIGQWLSAVPSRSQLIMDATSASGAALEQWAADGRIVITATRSGAERNATRFGAQWAEALSSPEADTDKDEVITAQEAFDFASRKVKDSYTTEGTLATEHPQIKGDAAAHLTVARLTERKARTPAVEALYSRLGDLEGQIEQLRQRRDQLDSATYLNQLQPLLVELAEVQQKIDTAEGRAGSSDAGSSDAGSSVTERASPPSPTAPNGGVDRQSLPGPGQGPPAGQNGETPEP
ncbi:MAG TPA: hypothetical protein VFV10_20605 [Gammaproteobacteria bacterium]|nr:hypothetical protein [Gammaproteobacteria bacterium]